jgi:hypothetical protein
MVRGLSIKGSPSTTAYRFHRRCDFACGGVSRHESIGNLSVNSKSPEKGSRRRRADVGGIEGDTVAGHPDGSVYHAPLLEVHGEVVGAELKGMTRSDNDNYLGQDASLRELALSPRVG